MIGSPASTAPAPAFQQASGASGSTPAGPARGGGAGPQTGSLVWWIVLGGLFVLWAVVHQHEKVREAIKPGNVAVNLHNILLIVLATVVGINFVKIALAKTAVWLPISKPVVVPLLTLVGGA